MKRKEEQEQQQKRLSKQVEYQTDSASETMSTNSNNKTMSI